MLSAGVALCTAFAVAAFADDTPRPQLALAAGSAWLASPGEGLVTLLDGASEVPVVSVEVGSTIAQVVQDGASALAFDAADGSLRKVDGALYEAGRETTFGTDLSLFAGAGRTYLVDAAQRVVLSVDREQLTITGRTPLRAAPGPGQGAVDESGRLWVVDGSDGSLYGVDGSGDPVEADAGPAARVVVVQGRPVLLDPERGAAGWLDDDGGFEAASCWDAGAGDTVQVLGSQSAPRFYAAVSNSGQLLTGNLADDACADPVPVGEPGDEFGDLVEAQGYVFVPNRSDGQVYVVDAASGEWFATLPVLRDGSGLELVAEDGVVFYNDLAGDTAGVLRYTGGGWEVGTPGKKYGKDGPPRGQAADRPEDLADIEPPTGDRDGGEGGGSGAGTAPVQGGAPPPVGPDGRGLPPGTEPTDGAGVAGTTDESGSDSGTGDGSENENENGNENGNEDTSTSLTLQVVGDGRIDVSPPPTDGGGACGPDDTCTFSYDVGAEVRLEIANPLSGAVELSLSGACTGTDLSSDPAVCTVPMENDASVTARYAAPAVDPPEITDLSLVTADPRAGQTTKITATVRGEGLTWHWDIDGPVPGSADTEGGLEHVFPKLGGYTVTLTVGNTAGDDSEAVDLEVAATVEPTAATPNPLNLVDATSGDVSLPWPYCDTEIDSVDPHVANGLTIAAADWRAAGTPDCAFVVTVSRSGIPGEGGLLSGAVSFIVNGGSGPSVDVQVPEKPKPDDTLPDVSLTANGSTGSSQTSANSFTISVSASDRESAVTGTEIWISSSGNCDMGGGIGKTTGGGLVGGPRTTANGSSVQYTVSVHDDLPCGSGTLVSGGFSIWAKATSEGGTRETGSITVTYQP